MYLKEKTAVIDVGSNSVKITVFDEQLNDIYHNSVTSRLGQGFVSGVNELQPEPVIRTIEAIVEFIKKAADYDCHNINLLATEAVRRADNKEWFADLLKASTGLDLSILSPEQEAQYAVTAASAESGLDTFVMMDTGGASTEFVYVKNGIIQNTISFPWGGVVLNAAFPEAEFLNAVSYVTDGLSSVSWLSEASGLSILALGGSVRVYNRFSVHYSPYEFVTKILPLTLDERIKMGIPSDRADILPVGLVPLIVLSSIMDSTNIRICNSGIRDGFVISKACNY